MASSLDRGAVIHLVVHYLDGLGDITSAVDLARELKTAYPHADFPIVIENPVAYRYLAGIFLGFRPQEDENLVEGVPILRGDALAAKRALESAELIIQPVPSSGRNVQLQWSRAPLNLYLEEPGVPQSLIEYSLPRNQVEIDEAERRHLLLPTGFSRLDWGFTFSPPVGPYLSRAEILALFKAIEVLIPAAWANLPWTTAYAHPALKIYHRDYVEALITAMEDIPELNHIVVFDFTHEAIKITADRFRRHRPFRIKKTVKILIWDPSQEAAPDLPREKALVIIRVGHAPRQLFTSIMLASDLPVGITGTQSLFEAIAAGIPCIHEFVPWKIGLNFGLAEIAAETFSGKDREFLIDWACGMGDRLQSPAEVRLAYQRYQIGKIFFWGFRWPGRRHRRALGKLVSDPDRQQLLKQLFSEVSARKGMASRLDRCVESLKTSQVNAVLSP